MFHSPEEDGNLAHRLTAVHLLLSTPVHTDTQSLYSVSGRKNRRRGETASHEARPDKDKDTDS